MSISPQNFAEAGDDALAERASRHLWMHFTRHSTYTDGSGHVPVIVRGDGAYIWDDQGKRYLAAGGHALEFGERQAQRGHRVSFDAVEKTEGSGAAGASSTGGTESVAAASAVVSAVPGVAGGSNASCR